MGRKISKERKEVQGGERLKDGRAAERTQVLYIYGKMKIYRESYHFYITFMSFLMCFYMVQ